MGQKEKARAIVAAEYEFTASTNLSADEVVDRARKAAEASKRGLGAGIRHEGDKAGDGGSRRATFSVRGPAGVVGIMDFVVTAEPEDGPTSVNLHVGDFLFQKGNLGMKPTINAKSTMKRFLEAFKASL